MRSRNFAESPNTLNIFLTKLCNLKCKYCFVDKYAPGRENLSISFLKKGIRTFLKLPAQTKTISFIGGEPLLKFGKIKKACQLINLSKKTNSQFIVTTTSNGTLFTKNKYNFFKKNGVILRCSIDGTQYTHDQNRPFIRKKSGSSYKKIISNIQSLRLSKAERKEYKINVELVFTPKNISSLIKNIKHLWKIGFGYIDFFPDLYAVWSKTELQTLKKEFVSFSNFYIEVFSKNSSEDSVFENSLLHTFAKKAELYKPLTCSKVHLDWHGNFFCCDKIFSIPFHFRKKFLIGNVKDGINNQLRLKILKDLRKEIKKTTGVDCLECRFVKYCFCSIGHYIYFSAHKMDFKTYFPQFCRISQIYVMNFLKILKVLNTNPLFSKIYYNKFS